MKYILHTLKSVFGIALVLIAFEEATSLAEAGASGLDFYLFITFCLLFLSGLFLVIHGLFTGMEAVATTIGNNSDKE